MVKKTTLALCAAAIAAALAVGAVELPSGYSQGEYIDIEKGCCFDTDFRPNEQTKVVAEVTVRNDWEYWFGAWNRDFNRGAFALGNASYCVYAGFGDEGGEAQKSTMARGRHTLELDAAGFRLDGATVRTFKSQKFQLLHPLSIGMQNRAGKFFCEPGEGTIRLHSLRIFDQGKSVRHYVPAINADGLDGLFDQVEGKFYYPISTGPMATAYVGGAKCREVHLERDYPYTLANLKDVAVTGGFWLPRFETNRIVTVWTDFKKCEETGRTGNFKLAAQHATGGFKCYPWDDSDVYKVIEGACYTLATHPDPKLEKYVDELVGYIAGAQEHDGYLYTARTLHYHFGGAAQGGGNFGMMGPTRWSSMVGACELYCIGHLYEAAVAHYEVTGKRTFLNVAIKNADLLDRTFGTGPGQIRDVPGCQEVELALAKLYRVTGEKRYLALARRFLDMRGQRSMRATWGVSVQDHLPVLKQTEAVGHAVRACYQYTGMADIAALMGDADYAKACDILWDNVVGKKLHLNGGVGAWRHHTYKQPGLGEAWECFAEDYELPNENAYLETCAAISYALWNDRLFRMYGDAKYMDVIERTIYNGFLSGISISGDEFFYPNPQASKGGYKRSKWFGCSCCPVNIVRFIPQIAQYAYATKDNAAYVNLFIDSTAKLPLKSGTVKLTQRTNYPWDGESKLVVAEVVGRAGARPSQSSALCTQHFTLNIRVPGWCVGKPVPSDLYTQTAPGSLADYTVKVNGEVVDFGGRGAPALPGCRASLVKGYCAITREWKDGDTVEIAMNMPVKRIQAHDKVEFDRGRLAVERGPLMYCAEGVDNGGKAFDAKLAADATFTTKPIVIAATPMVALVADGGRGATALPGGGRDGSSFAKATEDKTRPSQGLVLVPYFAWDHRGAGEMQSWFLTE